MDFDAISHMSDSTKIRTRRQRAPIIKNKRLSCTLGNVALLQRLNEMEPERRNDYVDRVKSMLHMCEVLNRGIFNRVTRCRRVRLHANRMKQILRLFVDSCIC